MTKQMTDPQNYTDIAAAIRGKNGSTDTYKPSEMAAAITALPDNMLGKFLSQGMSGVTVITDDVLGDINLEWGKYVRLRDSSCRQAPITSFTSERFSGVGSSCFFQCTALTFCRFGKATRAYYPPWQQCTALKRCELPAVTYFEANPFAGCSSLETLIVGTDNGGVVCTLAGVLGSVDTTKIYVPDDLVDSYKTATNWSTRADYIFGISELPEE